MGKMIDAQSIVVAAAAPAGRADPAVRVLALDRAGSADGAAGDAAGVCVDRGDSLRGITASGGTPPYSIGSTTPPSSVRTGGTPPALPSPGSGPCSDHKTNPV